MLSMDTIEKKVDSKFRFVLLAARRAEQLIRGAEPRVEESTSKVAWTAMDELLEDKVQWGYGQAPEELDEAELLATEEGEGAEASEESEVH